MNDKLYFRFIAILLILFLLLSCRNEITPPVSLTNLETRFLSGYISANLMPIIPPDPINCQIVLLAKNKSSSETLSGLHILQAEVYRDSGSQRLGTISFSTDWDGRLAPQEQDTVRLTKVVAESSLFTPPCNKYVYLNLLIKSGLTDSTTTKIDSLLFTCVF